MPLLRRLRRLRTRSLLGGVGIAAALGAVAFAGQASFSASGQTTYTVKAGDSLWAIASEYHTTVAQLAAANGLNASGILLIGTHLVIPGSSTAVASAATASTSSSSSSAPSTADFCTTFSMPGGSEPLPASLAADPAELALRPYFVQWADAYGVMPSLLEAIGWQESGWQEGAVSSASAVGVGQLLPSTASFVSQQLLGTNLNIDAASDNIRMSARYLAYLLSATGNTCSAIAAYNEGLVNLHDYGVLPQVVSYVRSVAAFVPDFQ